MEAFLWFISGAILMRLLQWVLMITPNYYAWKHTEYTVLQILAELHVQKLTAIKILQLVYEEADRMEEYEKAKSLLEQKYDTLINNSLNNMKNNLPYKVEYNNVSEAAIHYAAQKKENRDV